MVARRPERFRRQLRPTAPFSSNDRSGEMQMADTYPLIDRFKSGEENSVRWEIRNCLRRRAMDDGDYHGN